MATFNSVTFTPLADDGMYWPHWEQEPTVTIRHIPYSDTDDIQWGGLGQFSLTVRAYVTSSADIATLRGSADGTARDLTGWNGSTYSDVYLTEVKNVRRHESVDRWLCTLTFIKDQDP